MVGKQGFNIDFGDATSHEVLKHANLESANLVIIAISGSKIIPAIISSIRSFRPDVRIIVRAQYIRDMNVLKQFADVDVLVAEVETSVELLARALKVYGVEGEDIQTYMTKAKKQLMTYSNISVSSCRMITRDHFKIFYFSFCLMDGHNPAYNRLSTPLAKTLL